MSYLALQSPAVTILYWASLWLELMNLSGRTPCFSYRSFIITIASGLEESKPLKDISLNHVSFIEVLQNGYYIYPGCCYQVAGPAACYPSLLSLVSPLLFGSSLVTESEDSEEDENCQFSRAP